MPVLENSRHEAFARNVAKGMSGSGAYRLVYKEVTNESADSAGSRLLGIVQVSERVAELKAEAAKIAVITLAEWQQWHRDAMFTPIAELDENHYLAQEVTREYRGGQKGRLKRGDAHEGNEEASEIVEVVKIKSVSKQDSAKALAQHFGWTKDTAPAAEIVEGLGELLRGLCRPGIPVEPTPEAPAAE